MPDRKIEIEILAKGKPAEKGIDRVKKKTKDLQTQTERSGKAMTASWAKIGIAVAGLTLAFKKLSDTYSVQLKAEIALQNALKINAKEGENTLQVWKNYASALQDVTLYGDEATLQQIALIKTMGLSDDQTKKVIETAMDYATAFGKDLPSAVRELTMTLSGQIGTIKRTIPAIGEYTKEQLKAGVVIDAVAEKVKGQATALANTPWGKTQQLVNQFGDEMERLGKISLDVASESGALGFLKDFLSGISTELDQTTQKIRALKGELSKQERLAFLQAELKILQDQTWFDDIISQLNVLGQAETLALGNRQKRIENLKKSIADLSKELLVSRDEEQDAMEASIVARQKQLDAERKAYEELKAQAEDYIGNITRGMAEYAKSIDDPKAQIKALEDVGKKSAKALEDYFVNMAMGVETSFSDMARAVIADLIRMQIRASVVKPLANFLGIPSSHTGTTEVKHTGGYIGRLPSYHMGMRSDERLAKLQVGEAVVNRAGASLNRGAIDAMNAGYQVGGTGNVTQAEINFNVQAIDAVSFNNYLVGNKQTIENIINNSLQTNGTVRRTIKQVI